MARRKTKQAKQPKAVGSKRKERQQRQAAKAQEKRPFFHRDMTSAEKVVATILFLAFVIFVYLSLPLSRIASLSVRGNVDVSTEDVIRQSGLKPNQLFFEPVFYPQNITNQIKSQYPKINQVTYQLEANNQLVINVEEYDVVATVTNGAQEEVILSNGSLVTNYYQKYNGSVTAVTWNGNADALDTFAQEFAKVDSGLQKQITSATYDSADLLSVHLYMLDGNSILANYTDFASKMAYYPSLVSQTNNQKGQFDFSVGIYFSPYR